MISEQPLREIMRMHFGKMKDKIFNLGKNFFAKKWGDTKIKIHSECVIEICLGMSKNTNLNKISL